MAAYFHYNRLIERARTRALAGYVERHHVIPRCMGGSDDAENIVRLTPEEHFVAHQLLVKIYPDNHRLVWALSAMTNATKNQQRNNNKRYGWVRRLFSETMRKAATGRVMSATARAKMSKARRGIPRAPHSEETKAKMRSAAKGRPKSEAHKAALSAAKMGKTRKLTAQGRANHADAMRKIANTRNLSFIQAPAYKAAQSAQMKRVWAERKAARVAE